MEPAVVAVLRSWPFDPWLLFGLAVTAGIYLRGWLSLRCRASGRWQVTKLAAFLGGLAVIFLALASPIDTFAAFLLQVHMVQHLLLMMAAPPLLWLGEPLIPLLRGLPRPVRIYWVAPLFRSAAVRRVFETLTQPMAALILFTATTWFWHLPPVYEVALRSNGWHYVQHLCFLFSGLFFWYPVVRPFPARPEWSRWLLFPCLILADLQNTVLSALLTFSNRVLYPYYAEMPRLFGVSALDDQATAGVLMWVPGSVVYLLPLFAIGLRMLSGAPENPRSRRTAVPAPYPSHGRRLSLPLVADPTSRAERTGFDLLRVPVVGPYLRWRHARIVAQLILCVLAGLVILDGLTGPQVGAMNLAGVLPWIHWRGFLIVGLLSAGNLFCFACPFTAPRTLARRWLAPRRSWPRALRSKWLAVGLLVLFFWGYEAFALWNSPWWTAWIAIGYFVSAFAVDALFRGAAFCKYVCPVGQFNFVQSLISPLEVKVRDPRVCETCRTRDCIRGRDGIPGCGTGLFQPRKAGNLDCTFCLDCAHACPHDNVGILVNSPGSELYRDTFRSGIGRFGRRPDVATLAVLLVFAAFANAAGMVAPVARRLDYLSTLLGQSSTLLSSTLFYVATLGVLPVLTIAAATAASRRWGRLSGRPLEVASRFAFALVPLGFGMWLAHYSFHFLTGYDAVVPVTQRFATEWGWSAPEEPEWLYACCRPVQSWLLKMEIVALDFGLVLSLYTAYRLSMARSPRPLRALVPWAALLIVLFAVGIWTVFQPMQMRGTLPAGG
jgi:cytochrome c oxidase assembly factor CtaG/polyferredoxin